MKKKIGLSIFLGIVISVILGMQNFAQATIVSNDPTVSSGETIHITLTATEPVSSFKVKLVDSNGLTFSSASLGSSFSSVGFVNNEEGIINAALLQGTGTTLGTYTFTAPVTTETKTYTVKFEITGTNNGQDKTNTSTVTVKGTGERNNGGSTGGNDNTGNTGGGATTTPTHNFKSVNDTVYATENVRVRTSPETGNVLGQLVTGESVNRTGIGDNGWDRVSYKGHTAYVSNSYLTTTAPTSSTENPQNTDNNNEEQKPQEETTTETIAPNLELSNITVQEGNISPAFQKDITEYTLMVGEKVEDLHIEAITADENSKVTIAGNTQLKLGSNIVTITVTASDGTSKVYTIRVTKRGESDLKLTTLKITALNMEIPLTEGVFEYAFKLESEKILKEIEFTALANEENARIEITGNKNMLEGENIIYITVISADGEEQVNYTITVTNVLKEGATGGIQIDVTLLIVIGTILLTAYLIALLLIWKYVSDKKKEEEELDEDISPEEMEAIGVSAQEHSFEKMDDMSYYEEIQKQTQENEEEMPRKRKGKHF